MAQAQPSKEELLRMNFSDFIEMHRAYITQFTRIMNSGLYNYTVRDVCKLSRNDMKKFRNIGNLSVKEIEAVFAMNKLSLSTNYERIPKAELKESIMREIIPIISSFVDGVIHSIDRGLGNQYRKTN